MQVFGGFFFECNIPIFLRILLFKLENVKKKNTLTIFLPIEQQKIPYLGKRTQEIRSR